MSSSEDQLIDVPTAQTENANEIETKSNEPETKPVEGEQLLTVDLQGERLQVVSDPHFQPPPSAPYPYQTTNQPESQPPPPSTPYPYQSSDQPASTVPHQTFPQGKVTITVSDPVNLGDSLKQHTKYKVTTTVTDQKDGNLQCLFQAQVERRYSDFLWLADVLREKFVGYLIPPLPEKKAIGRFETETLQSRMKGFVSFLARCCSHPNKNIKQSPEFLVFLQGTQQELDAMKAQKAKETSSSEKFSRWLSETVASLASSKSSDNLQNDRYYFLASQLGQVIETLRSHNEEKIKKTKGEALGWQDISKAAQALAEQESRAAEPPAPLPVAVPVESKEGVSSSSSPSAPSSAEGTKTGFMFSKFAEAADQLAKITALRADNEHVFLNEPLQDLQNYCESVKLMVREKVRFESKYQENVTLLARQIQRLQIAKENRAYLQQQVDQLNATVNTQQAQLGTINTSIDEEMKRFQLEKEKEVKQALVSFIKDQIEHAQKTQQTWEALLEKIQQ